MRIINKYINSTGIAWIPVLFWAFLGSVTVIGGSVAVDDYITRSAGEKNKQTAEAKQILRDQLNEFFNSYRSNCFSRVASIGNRAVYQQALEDIILAFDESRKPDAQAEYASGVIFTQKPITQYDLSSDVTRADLQRTIWHELTHYLETQNYDRMSIKFLDPRRQQVKMRNERHTEYMETTLNILQQFRRLETRVKKGELTAGQIKSQLTLLQKQFADGSANSYEAVPKDLDKLASYTGFSVDFNKIIDYYKQGTCIKFPEGAFPETAGATQNPVETTNDSEKYVVFEGTNATVGIVIGTKKQYETEESASSYPGGGLDPKLILKKELLSGDQVFNTFAEAEKWICDQFTDIAFWPLGVGWRAKLNGRDVFLANTSCGK